ncbi:hypothetical protein K474DRAFT_1687078 [Panus rudis PR-1116 ss-1]|nr:hypothetical protein K474DRAFT_1687078 [Panus rudis PR-1116 ss-1]
MPRRRLHNPFRYQCPWPECEHPGFRSTKGLSYHWDKYHARANLPRHRRSSSPRHNQHSSPNPSAGADEGLFENTEEFDIDMQFAHSNSGDSEYTEKILHSKLNASRCDSNGQFTANPSPADNTRDANDWYQFGSRTEFRLANFLYRHAQMSQGNIDELLDMWAETLLPYDAHPPFADHQELLSLIDEIEHGDAPWQSFSVRYTGDIPEGPNPPSWMLQEYEVWYRDPRVVAHNMLRNLAFKDKFDYIPYREYDGNGRRRLQNVMSANWSWREADKIATDEATHGSMFVPIILGSDKTTVSVATGNNEYYPLYMSLGNFHNDARRAHCDSVIPISFLAIPKCERKSDNDKTFRMFRRQLFHSSISAIFQNIKPFMEKPDIVVCPDGYYHRAIYSFGPYITDYPEQVLLTLIVQGWCPRCTANHENLDGSPATRRSREHWAHLIQSEFGPSVLWDEYGYISDVLPFTDGFPRADIHELIAPDLLHQVIKGTFKDHLVEWVIRYLKAIHGEARANEIIDDIDRRIAAVPHFTGLRRFPQGQRFKQWTGDDSKALMKVFLPAIPGHVPDQMVRCIADFLDFCYLARQNVLDNDSLNQLDQALASFHTNREVFLEHGVRPNGFSLPRQHSLKHYRALIEEFGAPNGLCSSITEAKHIRAVKQPWRRSSRYELLGQILTMNQRQDKLSAAYSNFEARGMLAGTDLIAVPVSCEALEAWSHQSALTRDESEPSEEDEEDAAPDNRPKDILGEVILAKKPARGYPTYIDNLGQFINEPELSKYVAHFLYQQRNPHDDRSPEEIPMHELPCTRDIHLRVFHSAATTYFAPSDVHGINGMHRERIRAIPKWRNGPGRYNCILVETDSALPGFRGLHVARVRLFFDFTYSGKQYPCALVEWFIPESDGPDEVTGMWIVKPERLRGGRRAKSVVHLDSVLRAAHLIPAFGKEHVPANFSHTWSLDCFNAYYVNKYADHHMYEIVF